MKRKNNNEPLKLLNKDTCSLCPVDGLGDDLIGVQKVRVTANGRTEELEVTSASKVSLFFRGQQEKFLPLFAGASRHTPVEVEVEVI